VKNDPARADRQGARVRVTCRGLSGNFLSWWHVLHNSMHYVTSIQTINVGRLNYVYIYKYSTFTSIKVNNVHNTPYKNPAHSFSETCVFDKSVRGPMSSTVVCRVNFCQGDLFYLILLRTFYIHKS